MFQIRLVHGTAMIRSASKIVMLAGVFAAGGFAIAEDASAPAIDPLANTAVDEEVVVRGRMRRSTLRVQIELAEEAFYNRFNEINSHDEFNIVCRREVEIGSRIPRRKCEPNFWRQAEADVGRETVIGLQGGYANNPQQFMGLAHFKSVQLEKEMRELAAADPELRQALARLATLRQAYSEYGND
jgi:hypothetical protein